MATSSVNSVAGDFAEDEGCSSSRSSRSKGVKHLMDASPQRRSIPPQFILPPHLRPSPVFEASIPVIDLYGLHGPGEARTRIVQEIKSAFLEWGVFQVINHGVKACLMEEMLGVVKGFFSLPWEKKVKYFSDDVMHPVRYGTSLNTPLAHTHHWRDYLRHYGHPVETTIHLWPQDPINYRDVTKEYVEELWRVLVDLAGVISEGLGLGSEHLKKFLGHGFQPIASNYYPPCPEPELTLGLAAHSDHGFLTILLDNGVLGLQVKQCDTWVSVARVPGAFIVNAGDCLEMLTNGRYKSVEHRAVVNKDSARISVGVGSGPHLDATVAPLDHLCEEDGGPKFKPVVYRDYVRLQQSITSRGKNALQNGQWDKALAWFRQMHVEGMKSNAVTAVSILSARADARALKLARLVHL